MLSPWRLLLGLFDAAIVALAMFIAVTLGFSGKIPPLVWETLQGTLPVAMALMVICNTFFGLYNRVWKYASVETAMAIGLSTTSALLIAAFVGKAVAGPLPIAIWYTTWLFALFAVSISRFSWRFVRPAVEALTSSHARGDNGQGSQPRRVLLYGAGERGFSLVDLIRHQSHPEYCIVGLIDDDPGKKSVVVRGVRVLGSGDDLTEVVERYSIDEVVITIADLSKSRLQEILLQCRTAKVKATVMPSLLELVDGVNARPRDVNMDDLLGRKAPITHVALHDNYIEGNTVLVTGAGGSIGSELSRQICRHKPEHLILLGRGENRIHWIYLQLQERFPHLKVTPVIQNITVASAMENVFAQYRPDIVFHAAAHKHVYLMEPVPVEAVRNNVLATRDLARLADQYGVEKFIFISTDKAVSPTSVMGATKRACELLLTHRPCTKTQYVCVRFGNVLGSEGSVLEIFKRQWRNGEPLTVTHEDATRFFMSIPEASFLVMQAGALGRHGEIFLLDMGEPVRIKKLAEEFIALHGGNPYDANAIRIIGLQEGEKLHEALVYDNEMVVPTANEHIVRVGDRTHTMNLEAVEMYLRRLSDAVADNDAEHALDVLAEFTGGNLKGHQGFVLSKVI